MNNLRIAEARVCALRGSACMRHDCSTRGCYQQARTVEEAAIGYDLTKAIAQMPLPEGAGSCEKVVGEGVVNGMLAQQIAILPAWSEEQVREIALAAAKIALMLEKHAELERNEQQMLAARRRNELKEKHHG